jgi:L-cysteate sulfo-lyase
MRSIENVTRLARLISSHERISLGHFPTALEPLKRFGEWLGGPSVWVKRDDASGMGQGGNKVRALEFVLPEALAAGADILLTAGVVQSNSVRQVAAAAAKAGLDCHFAMITDRVDRTDTDYAQTGNIFLDHLYGATHEIVSIRDDRTSMLERIAARLRAEGRKPYIVPYGCANRLGGVGYLNAATEIATQAEALGVSVTHLVHASGTGGTQAGLIVGFAALGLPIEVIGIDIDADPTGVRQRVTRILRELAEDVGLAPGPLEDRIIIEDGFSAGAYGHADAPTVNAMAIAARLEALTLDPVYSAKALAALIGLSKAGRFQPSDNVVFLHTGGTPAIYAYRSLFGFGCRDDVLVETA